MTTYVWAGNAAEQISHFDQVADRLLAQQAYDDLARLLDTAELPAVSQARHLHAYLSGVLACEHHKHAEAGAVFDGLLGEPDVDPALLPRIWNSLGVNAQYRGRYDEALRCYHHAHDLFVAQNNLLGQAKTLFNLGTAHRHLHELAIAAAAFQDSLVLLDRLGARSWQTFALNGLGLVYTEQGRWSEAEQIYQRVISVCQLLDDPEGTGIAYTNLGELYLFTGRWAAAADALATATRLVTTPLSQIEIHLNEGLRQAAVQNLPAAASHFETAYALAVEHDNVRYQVWALYLRGNVLSVQQADAAALACYQQALTLVETLRGQIEVSDIRSHLFTTWQPVYMAAVLTCVRLSRPKEALTIAERARARVFFDLLGQGHTSQLQAPARTPLSAEAICQRLQPGTAALVYFCTGATVIPSIPADFSSANQVLACYLWPPSRVVGFTVSRAGTTAQCLSLAPDTLDQRAFDHDGRTLLGLTPGDNSQLLNPWTLPIVYEGLLAPLVAQLTTKTHETLSTLCIVPHGPLHRIPFHALRDETGHDLLAHEHDVIIAPSLSAWLQDTPPPLNTGLDTVFGYAPDLPNAQAEAEAVARLLDVPAIVGEQARRADFLAAAGRARVLHCSCHGSFDRRAPLQSALYLADGRITAADLLAADQLPMDLVFLSACESGRSHVEGADELMGLVRAFLLGGTRVVIVSLWRVDELSTRLLAEQFYQAYIGSRHAPARALRQAQLKVRALTWDDLARHLADIGDSPATTGATIERLRAMNETWRAPDTNHPFAHPYFWAGFVAVGS